MAQVLGLHHVAVAHTGERAPHRRLEELFGLEVCHVENGEGFTERMIPIGETYVQTLEATGPGVVTRFVEQHGPGLHHIAFLVDDLLGMLAQLRLAGIHPVEPAPRRGGTGTSVAFLHPRSTDGVLIELVEVSGKLASDEESP